MLLCTGKPFITEIGTSSLRLGGNDGKNDLLLNAGREGIMNTKLEMNNLLLFSFSFSFS